MSTTAAAAATREPFTFETTSDPTALRGPWTALAERSDNVFATYEWLATWWCHFGRDRPLLLTTVVDGDGDLVAILPLYVASERPVRIVRFLGHGLTDQLGPVCAVADRDLARRALAAYLRSSAAPAWDLAIGDELPVSPALLGARSLSRSPTHVVSLASSGTSGDAWLAARSPKLRAQLSRAGRGLERLGPVTYRTTDDPAHAASDLELLWDLHRLRWAAQGGSRSFAGREAFHHEVVRLLLPLDRLRLRFLELDGRPVAATYSFRFAGVESHYQSGRDPAFDAHSVGLLLHRHAIRSCADEGVRELRFLRGDEPYKRRLADQVVEQESVGWSQGPLGSAALAAVAQLPRLSRTQARWVPASWAWGTGGSPRWGPP
ncbi:MAG TPA: GNAT family N-acetyltransferase [Acidimicrobiales bacterium]|nr:GNAT family N-acetyltransferase [Acidimicrobiales bacterium]